MISRDGIFSRIGPLKKKTAIKGTLCSLYTWKYKPFVFCGIVKNDQVTGELRVPKTRDQYNP